jgi:hypothetical protein
VSTLQPYAWGVGKAVAKGKPCWRGGSGRYEKSLATCGTARKDAPWCKLVRSQADGQGLSTGRGEGLTGQLAAALPWRPCQMKPAEASTRLDLAPRSVLACRALAVQVLMMKRDWRHTRGSVVFRAHLLVAMFVLFSVTGARAQSNTRLLLASGWGVPEHAGFALGPFSGLMMNDAKDVVFLTSMRGAKSDLKAVMRSDGVTFSVVAFQGLRSPVPKATYESFSAPSLNNSGQIAFTTTLKDDVPASAVVRLTHDAALAIATSGNPVPDSPDSTFQEFSAPVISSAGNVLFAARLGGKQPGSDLFLWTLQGLKTVPIPAELGLKPTDLLVPIFTSHDEAVFVSRGSPREAATEQFFRAVANKNFQDLRPVPEESETAEVLPARIGEAPIKMLLVAMESGNVSTLVLNGDPTEPVKAKKTEQGTPPVLGRIQGQTTGPRGIIFAAAPAEQPNDLALYCYCDGQVSRLTSSEEFVPVTIPAAGRPISSLTGDGQHTMAFIIRSEAGTDATAIYVVSIP